MKLPRTSLVDPRGVSRTPPLGTQIHSFSCGFGKKNCKNNRLAHPLWELTPPGKSWIRHWTFILFFVNFQRYGGKRVFGYFMLMTAIATLLTPVGARGSPYILVTLRIFKGLGEVTLQLCTMPISNNFFLKYSKFFSSSKNENPST